MRRAMVDLETLDTAREALVLSVGIAIFDEKDIIDSVGFLVDRKEQQERGRTINTDTIEWWLMQSNEARAAVVGKDNRLSMLETATVLNTMLEGCGEVWANSPTFDLAIMRHFLYSMNMSPVWHYWQEQDVRGVKRIAKKLGLKLDLNGHEAEQDAINQAQAVILVDSKITK